jgi:hypothetical protein
MLNYCVTMLDLLLITADIYKYVSSLYRLIKLLVG